MSSAFYSSSSSAATTAVLAPYHRAVSLSSRVVANDRHWFQRFPSRFVRFRPERSGEFDLLLLQGQEPPVFIPDGLDPVAPLNWVAVVDICRVVQLPYVVHSGSIRARIRTVPIRSSKLQAGMAEVFAIAVCKDLLRLIETPGISDAEVA